MFPSRGEAIGGTGVNACAVDAPPS
jgi:hypothetical protein